MIGEKGMQKCLWRVEIFLSFVKKALDKCALFLRSCAYGDVEFASAPAICKRCEGLALRMSAPGHTLCNLPRELTLGTCRIAT